MSTVSTPSPQPALSDSAGGQQGIHQEMNIALQDLYQFQKRVLGIKQANTLDAALDQMEALLDSVVDFVYARLYIAGENGELQVARAMCPPDLELDNNLLAWASRNPEPAIIPLEEEADGALRSVLFLPLVGTSCNMGMLVLWLASDPHAFTQEQATRLMMLGLEAGAAVEAERFRRRLEKARAELADMVESVPLGLFTLSKDGQILLMNRTVEFMLNVRRDDAVGRHFRDVLPTASIGPLMQYMANAVQDEQEIKITLGGVETALGLSATPLMAGGGEPSGWVVLIRNLDITREVVKLRELDALKNDFLSLVSHELRTPLTSILAYSETLLMEGMVESEQERREYIEVIHNEGTRLMRLINDILDLAKMQAGKLEYRYEEGDINELIRSALTNSQSLIDQKGLHTALDLATDLPPVRMDADRIMQVLLNLISNAVKFTPEGGKITLSSRLSEPLGNTRMPSVTICVADTGIGIAPENLNRVFSKFEQVERVDHHSTGTGLGTSICKRIVEEGHGGRIWLESEVNKGTRVYFRIPVQ